MAAALPAMEELWKTRIKCQHSTYVSVCPRLMTPLWQKQLYIAADIIIAVLPGHLAWSPAMFEPLLNSIVFPFVQHAPWQLHSSPKMHTVAIGNCKKCGKTRELTEWIFLRKLCAFVLEAEFLASGYGVVPVTLPKQSFTSTSTSCNTKRVPRLLGTKTECL
jgi:hypothetical protein